MNKYLNYILFVCLSFFICKNIAIAAPKRAAKPLKPSASVAKTVEVQEVKYWSNPDYTRVVINLGSEVSWKSYELDKNVSGKPGRIVIDLQDSHLGSSVKDTPIGDGLLKQVRTALFKPGVVRVVLDTDNFKDYKVFPLSSPARIVIDVSGDRRAELRRLETTLSRQVQETAESKTTTKPHEPVQQTAILPATTESEVVVKTAPVISKIRRIVIDPGHGGHDPGAIGPNRLQEKDVVLSIGLKVRDLLKEHLGLDVVMTRSTDIFIPLEERTAIANKVGADLFISIHANAAINRAASGMETYYLNLAKTDKVAELAAKENGTTLEKVSVLQAILFDLMANYKLNDSAHLAEEVQKALYKTVGARYPATKNLGVKQGPFYVLVGATMPSILTEVAFISNRNEEKNLADPAYQSLTAEGIMEGVKGYINSLSQ